MAGTTACSKGDLNSASLLVIPEGLGVGSGVGKAVLALVIVVVDVDDDDDDVAPGLEAVLEEDFLLLDFSARRLAARFSLRRTRSNSSL